MPSCGTTGTWCCIGTKAVDDRQMYWPQIPFYGFKVDLLRDQTTETVGIVITSWRHASGNRTRASGNRTRASGNRTRASGNQTKMTSDQEGRHDRYEEPCDAKSPYDLRDEQKRKKEKRAKFGRPNPLLSPTPEHNRLVPGPSTVPVTVQVQVPVLFLGLWKLTSSTWYEYR
jgi:hypothetical protein